MRKQEFALYGMQKKKFVVEKLEWRGFLSIEIENLGMAEGFSGFQPQNLGMAEGLSVFKGQRAQRRTRTMETAWYPHLGEEIQRSLCAEAIHVRGYGVDISLWEDRGLELIQTWICLLPSAG